MSLPISVPITDLPKEAPLAKKKAEVTPPAPIVLQPTPVGTKTSGR